MRIIDHDHDLIIGAEKKYTWHTVDPPQNFFGTLPA